MAPDFLKLSFSVYQCNGFSGVISFTLSFNFLEPWGTAVCDCVCHECLRQERLSFWDECHKEALVLPSLLFHRNEGKGLTVLDAIWIGKCKWPPSASYQWKYTRLKGAYLVMMDLQEIYSEIKYQSKWTLNPCGDWFNMKKETTLNVMPSFTL